MNALSKAAIVATLLLSSSMALGQTVSTFNDVPEDYWAYAFIEEFAALGITKGCGNGNFCPEATVTRAQMAVFVIRAIDTVMQHHSFVSVPGASARPLFPEGMGMSQGLYYVDGSVYIAEAGLFYGMASVQLPDQLQILGMTCAGRVLATDDNVIVYLLRHPIFGSSEPEVIAAAGTDSAAPDFVELQGLAFEPDLAKVDNVNFSYTLFVMLSDSAVDDPLGDGSAFRGCSIEMSR